MLISTLGNPPMKIYNSEINDNLQDIILKNNTCAIAISDTVNSTETLHQLSLLKLPITKDSMFFHCVLVSTNWNKNDDIFVPKETWAALYTPVNKPVNINHNGNSECEENQTIGVINTAYPSDKKYNILTSDSIEPPAEFYNIIVGATLWEEYWKDEVALIKDNILSNKQFVSMECLFDGFNYGLKEANSPSVKVLPRNEETAWLSKHLRAYGGSGFVLINGVKYKIGRILVGITFSGMGLVTKPANDGSIVFNDFLSFASVSDEEIVNFSISSQNCVLNNIEEINMPKDTETDVQAQAQIQTLNDKLSRAEVDFAAKFEQAAQTIASLEAKIKDMTQCMQEKEDTCASLNAQVAAYKDKEVQMAKEKTAMARLASLQEFGDEVISTFGKDEGQVKEALANLSEAEFTRAIQIGQAVKKATSMTLTSLPKATEQTLTNETKLTEASVKEPEANLETVATNKVDNVISFAIAKLLSKEVKNKE